MEPPRWDDEVLAHEASVARAAFRDQRLLEPLARWTTVVAEYRKQFQRLFAEYGLEDPARLTPERLADLFKSGLGDALRYVAGPPISFDDLKVLADCSLAPGRLAKDREGAKRIQEILTKAVDPTRFPWLAEKRKPTHEEVASAVLASAVLVTAQRVSTDRRTEGKEEQEQLVKNALVRMGLREVAARDIKNISFAPSIGEFCGESLVGSRRADVPVRLFDGRLMCIECKVSNSSTNSVKRLNNDAGVKAEIWKKEFGTSNVVPTAVLSGVFKLKNLQDAQHQGLTLFWAHRLEKLKEFIVVTKSPKTAKKK